VEAIVGSTPFPCVYEDTTGGCYFFPPTGTQKFRIRGRKLADGTTPLPVDLEVVVKEAESRAPNTTEVPKSEPDEPDASLDETDAAETTDSQ
nr:hypothetical protein [Planctomycetota bacterium]